MTGLTWNLGICIFKKIIQVMWDQQVWGTPNLYSLCTKLWVWRSRLHTVWPHRAWILPPFLHNTSRLWSSCSVTWSFAACRSLLLPNLCSKLRAQLFKWAIRLLISYVLFLIINVFFLIKGINSPHLNLDTSETAKTLPSGHNALQTLIQIWGSHWKFILS